MSVRAVGAGGVEADPEELYRSVIGAGSRALAAAGAPADAVALANQGETVLAWDRRTLAAAHPGHRVAGPAVGRGVRAARGLGGPAGPAHRAAARPVLRGAQDDLAAGEPQPASGVVTTTDTWLLARLGGGYVTDAATASRTLLLDLDAAGWSAEACGIFGLDPATLPEVADCAAVTGETAAFGKAVPVAGLAVDQQAALLAERCFAAGQAKCTYGTGRVPARHHRGHGRALGQRPVRVDSLAAGRDADLLPGRAGLHRRRRHPVAGRGRPAPGRGRARRGRRVRPGQRRGDVPARRWPGSAHRTGSPRPAGRSSGSAWPPRGRT